VDRKDLKVRICSQRSGKDAHLSGMVEYLVRGKTTLNASFLFEAKPLGSLKNHPNEAPGLFQLIAGCLVAAELYNEDEATVWVLLTDLEYGLIVCVEKVKQLDGPNFDFQHFLISSFPLFDVAHQEFSISSPLILCCLARILMVRGAEDVRSFTM
jgi:hypothetical protein